MTSIRTRAADIIEPHITGDFKRRERAEDWALDLDTVGLLLGGQKAGGDAHEQAANVLQCRTEWPTAECVAAELAAAGLLTS